MSRLVTSDINTVGLQVQSAFESLYDSLDKIKSNLQFFIFDSEDHLHGEAYDAIRNRLHIYVDTLEKQMQLSSKLIEQISSSNNYMLNYAEGYTEIDDSKKAEIFELITRIKRRLETSYSETTLNEVTRNYLSVSKNLFLQLKRLEKYYDKISNLQIKDNYAVSMIEDMNKNTSILSNSITQICPLELMGFNYDRLTPESISILERLVVSWPENMEMQRFRLIEEAIYLSQLNIVYSTDKRGSVSKETGLPTYMDCSNFISYCCNAAGFVEINNKENKIPMGDKWGTSKYLDNSRAGKLFNIIEEPNWERRKEYRENPQLINEVLTPGDFALLYSGIRRDENGKKIYNHIVMYVGADENGNPKMIDCASKTPAIEIRDFDPSRYEIFIKYTAYGEEINDK